MKKYHLNASVIASSSTVWVGMDVAADDIAICILDEELNILAREKILHTEAAIHALSRRLPGCTVVAAYEAGPTGYQLLRWLRALHWDARMVAPSRVPVASGDRVKTDRRDALKIATLLAGRQLDDSFVNDLTDEQYADRQLVRCRTQQVRKGTAIRLQIKSAMLMHHIVPPPEISTKNWTLRFRQWLQGHESGHISLDLSIREQLLWLDEAKQALGRLNKHIARLASSARYANDVTLLRTIPGIGALTAMVLLTELPDLTARFESGESLCRYLGLVPTEHSTGKTDGRRGHLVRDGNSLTRAVLVEAAWRLVGKEGDAKERYHALKRRMEGKKAIVAVTRHLAMTIYAMFRDRAEYRRVKEPAARKQAA